MTLLHIHSQEKPLRESVLLEQDELAKLTDELYPTLLEKVVQDPSPEVIHSAVENSRVEIKEIEPSLHSHSDEICRYARDHTIDLIVIGAKVHSRIHDVLLGNLTTEVVQNAPCPVTVVH